MGTEVAAVLDFAASRFSNGEVTSFETLAIYESTELATILEIERWKASWYETGRRLFRPACHKHVST